MCSSDLNHQRINDRQAKYKYLKDDKIKDDEPDALNLLNDLVFRERKKNLDLLSEAKLQSFAVG